MGNLTKTLFEESIIQTEHPMSDEDINNINSGNYPIILFQNDEYTKIHITESEIEKYSNLDMTFEDMQTQWALHGNAVPIVTIVD
jgi:hypothetical protein